MARSAQNNKKWYNLNMDKEYLDGKIAVYKNINIDLMSLLSDIGTDGPEWTISYMDNRVYDPKRRNNLVLELAPNIDEMNTNRELYDKKQRLRQKIDAITAPYILDYCKENDIKLKTKMYWDILQYRESQHIEWHKDDGPHHKCVISFVIYFNDDYEGGEIQFKNFMGGGPIKPEPNSMLIFPPTEEYLHRVVPIVSGVKFAAISFGY